MQWPPKSSKLAPVLTCVYYLCLPNAPLVYAALTQTGLVFTILPPHTCTALLCLCLLVFTTLFDERCVGESGMYALTPEQAASLLCRPQPARQAAGNGMAHEAG